MEMYRTDDPLADFDRYEQDREAEAEKCPECAYCGEKIFDAFAFYIDGEWYHKDCLENEYYVEVVEE
jgi:hypothetical protein